MSKCLLDFLEINRVLILIGGPSGSGKSTLAKKLAKEINATIIEMDDFFYSKNERIRLKLGKTWDNPKMIEWELFHKVFKELLENKKVLMPVYHKLDGTRTFKKIKAKKIIIIEGIWALNERTKVNSNLRVFIDAKSSIRLERRLSRDTWTFERKRNYIVKNWVEMVLPNEKLFVNHSKKTADIVVNDSDSKSIETIINLIKTKVKDRNINV